MPLNKSLKTIVKQPMTDAQLAEWEASRDLEAELVDSVRQMKRGEGTVVHAKADQPGVETAKGVRVERALPS